MCHDAGMSAALPNAPVWLVPHTHWDREWYEPFQRFRLRLVDLMDDVTERALRDPGFRFTMDGQMAAVEDYLEVRPEARETVRRFAEAGAERIMLQDFLPWDLDMIDVIGEVLVGQV